MINDIFGDPFSVFGTGDRKKVPVKKKTKKPEVGGKLVRRSQVGKTLPEKKVICPYCKTVNTFPKGKASRFCSECGKAYFRP